MSKLTEKEMREILRDEVPLYLIQVDNGIFEFHEDGNMSIGISYEQLGINCTGYIFNLFKNGQYISIPNSYNNIYDAVEVLTEEWNRWCVK